MMHERIRAADEDFADINLGIIRFEVDNETDRSVGCFSDEGAGQAGEHGRLYLSHLAGIEEFSAPLMVGNHILKSCGRKMRV